MLVFFFSPEIYCQYMFLGLLGVFITKREKMMNNRNKKSCPKLPGIGSGLYFNFPSVWCWSLLGSIFSCLKPITWEAIDIWLNLNSSGKILMHRLFSTIVFPKISCKVNCLYFSVYKRPLVFFYHRLSPKIWQPEPSDYSSVFQTEYYMLVTGDSWPMKFGMCHVNKLSFLSFFELLLLSAHIEIFSVYAMWDFL